MQSFRRGSLLVAGNAWCVTKLMLGVAVLQAVVETMHYFNKPFFVITEMAETETGCLRSNTVLLGGASEDLKIDRKNLTIP